MYAVCDLVAEYALICALVFSVFYRVSFSFSFCDCDCVSFCCWNLRQEWEEAGC